MNDQELMTTTKELVKKEKQYTLQILKHLEEIDRRRCFADLGYSSLFQYCVKELFYSEMEAAARVNSARLLRTIPVVGKKIVDGTISLTTASQLQTFIKKEKIKDENLKLMLINEVSGKSKREVEQILLSRESKSTPKMLKLELSDKIYEKLLKLQTLVGGGDLDKLIETLVDHKLDELKPKKESKKTDSTTRYIPVKVQREVNTRAQHRCEYISPITGKRCTAIHYLQYDHITPFSKGGVATTTNIQRICSIHNLRKGSRS